MSTSLTTTSSENIQEMNYFRQLCAIAAKSKAYAGLDEATMLNIMLTAKDLGISPMKALNGGFYIVNGKISMSTALMADRVRTAGHSVKVIEWTIQKCVIIGKRTDNEDSCKVEYTMEDAQLAGLTSSPTWKKHPKAMLYNRAMSMLARVLFPDVVGNAYSEDEKHEIQNIPAHKRPEEDPFIAAEVTEVKHEAPPILYESLQYMLETRSDLKVDVDRLKAFTIYLAAKSNKSEEEIKQQAIASEGQSDRYMKFYQAWNDKQKEASQQTVEA